MNSTHQSLVLLDATYIHHSGGKVLLEYFIDYLKTHHQLGHYYFFIDHRLESDSLKICDPNKIFRTRSTEKNRKYLYKKIFNFTQIHSVFCFNNVPPPLKINNKQIVILFHNILIIDKPLYPQRWKERLSFLLKKMYLKLKNQSNYRWVVQSNLVKVKLKEEVLIRDQKCDVLPFFADNSVNTDIDRENSFLYLADGVPQKNHKFLFQVWESLKNTFELTPKLYVTINTDSYPYLAREIERLQKQGVQIINLGIIPYSEIDTKYLNSKYVIFPSLAESFGLPLIEAAQKGNYILAIDLPYVHEVVKPSAVFDAHNIVETVKLISKVYTNEISLPATELRVKNKIVELNQLIKGCI